MKRTISNTQQPTATKTTAVYICGNTQTEMDIQRDIIRAYVQSHKLDTTTYSDLVLPSRPERTGLLGLVTDLQVGKLDKILVSDFSTIVESAQNPAWLAKLSVQHNVPIVETATGNVLSEVYTEPYKPSDFAGYDDDPDDTDGYNEIELDAIMSSVF